MTYPLPWTEPVEPNEVRDNFDALAQAFPIQPGNLANAVLLLATTGTPRKIAFGTATVTWPGGSPDTTATTVTHGVGATPFVIATPHSAVVVWTSTVGATTFNVQAETNNGSSPAAATTASVDWVAIG